MKEPNSIASRSGKKSSRTSRDDLLIAKGADINAKEKSSRPPANGRSPQTIRTGGLLKKAGANLSLVAAFMRHRQASGHALWSFRSHSQTPRCPAGTTIDFRLGNNRA